MHSMEFWGISRNHTWMQVYDTCTHTNNIIYLRVHGDWCGDSETMPDARLLLATSETQGTECKTHVTYDTTNGICRPERQPAGALVKNYFFPRYLLMFDVPLKKSRHSNFMKSCTAVSWVSDSDVSKGGPGVQGLLGPPGA